MLYFTRNVKSIAYDTVSQGAVRIHNIYELRKYKDLIILYVDSVYKRIDIEAHGDDDQDLIEIGVVPSDMDDYDITTISITKYPGYKYFISESRRYGAIICLHTIKNPIY